MLPPERAARLVRLQAAARALDLPLGETAADQLITYLDLLARWNATYNLTAVRDQDQMLIQHLFDCLAVIRPLKRQLGDKRKARLLDVGSGGGLPGVVIAVTCPDIEITCVDTVGKKAAFIQQVAATLRLPNLHARHARVEQLDPAAPYDVIASRAFASLADFVALTRRWLAPDGVWMAMKGKHPADELAVLDGAIDVFHVEQLTVPELNAERCIVWMRPGRSL